MSKLTGSKEWQAVFDAVAKLIIAEPEALSKAMPEGIPFVELLKKRIKERGMTGVIVKGGPRKKKNPRKDVFGLVKRQNSLWTTRVLHETIKRMDLALGDKYERETTQNLVCALFLYLLSRGEIAIKMYKKRYKPSEEHEPYKVITGDGTRLFGTEEDLWDPDFWWKNICFHTTGSWVDD